MGCGQSKGDPEREVAVLTTSKFTPLLRWRFEEIRGRTKKNINNADSDGALSKKGLLKHSNNHEDDASLSLSNSQYVDENDKKSDSSSQEESARPSSAVGYKDEDYISWEQKKENKSADNNNYGLEQERLLSEDKDAEENENEEETEAEGRLSNVNFSPLLCPGSPSFRVYCVNIPVDNASDDADYKDDEYDQRSHGTVENSEATPSANSNELPQELMAPRKVKAKKGGRFRRVMMGKGRPAAVKNLLNVTSCYHPSRSSRHNNPRLLPQQAA